ncbi:RNA-binding protein 4.1-like isoform X2 [Anguilla anguilla]|uniref:RNA-binding protein 4.1-like isoform X2 n=1 Tax=Anguilla anguilla TaxID=7936 RepID=UPI0015B0692A|nr:RNA-binding protein 4.1-like isoform X2 [Anguilla anguilla]
MVKIFIGNLSQDTTAEELRSLFSQYGKISECDIVKNFGFVHMDDKAEAEEAIRNLHHYELNGLAMNVELSRSKSKASTKLHVGNISSSCTNQELRAKFEEYGPVVECDIVKDYAFVHMERVEDAMEAISGLDNTAFQGSFRAALPQTRAHSRSRFGSPRFAVGAVRGDGCFTDAVLERHLVSTCISLNAIFYF